MISYEHNQHLSLSCLLRKEADLQPLEGLFEFSIFIMGDRRSPHYCLVDVLSEMGRSRIHRLCE